MPLLLPGLLQLSRRARYFSFHSFLLDEYRRRKYPADKNVLSSFIKRREWEFGLAVQRCPRHCGSSPVGARRLSNTASGAGPFPRGESVESNLGGYGLYYRSPLIDFGVVAPWGTLLGDQPIPIDVLRTTARASALADTFRDSVEHTEYFRRWMVTDEPIPSGVIDEFAEVACLCRLVELPEERAAVHAAIFSDDPEGVDVRLIAPVHGTATSGVSQRRRSVAHYLTLVRDEPLVVDSEASYREALWSPRTLLSDSHRQIAGQWAALIAKDVWQEAICSVWLEFCRRCLDATRDKGRGLTWQEVRDLSQHLVQGPPLVSARAQTATTLAELSSGDLGMASSATNLATMDLEDIREWTVRMSTATSGLLTVLELARRMEAQDGDGFTTGARVESAWQLSVASVVDALASHLAVGPSVADTMWWLVSTFVLPVHERIAYSKLPELTFRFRWDDGLLRFYDHGVERFPLAAIRDEPLALLTRDLGFWEPDDTGDAMLTPQGTDFISEVLE